MSINLYNMNYSIIIIFAGNVKDFDNQQSQCQWNIPANPNETVGNLILRFFQITGISKEDHRLYFNNMNLESYKNYALFQLGLTNNSRIDISYIELESLNSKILIFIKFIKSNINSAYNCKKDLKGILKLCLLNEMASKIDATYLENIYNMKKIPLNVYYILKTLKKSLISLEENNEAGNTIKKILEKKGGCNIINFSNFVDKQINTGLVKYVMNLVPEKDLDDINNTIKCLGKYDIYMDYFEKEIIRALKDSVFEFSIVSLVVLDRQDYDNFESKRAICPNRTDKILYHGTQIQPIYSILNGFFKRSIKFGCQHGKGVYFTDSLDTCWFYGGPEGNRANVNKIPGIGDTFTAITSMVYYDRNGFLKVNGPKTREYPGKNQINFAFAAGGSETLEKPDPKKFYGTEFVIWDLDQICPFISVKFKRDEYCVIWRDDNFSEKPVFNNKYDPIFKQFLKDRLKYIKQEAKYNVYPCTTTEEALKLVNRKKYNKIILISNVRPDLEGKKFVEQARQIIGNNVIVLFLSFSIQHLEWIKNYENALFSNEKIFYEEYLDSFDSEPKMRELISKMENHYKIKFNIDDTFLNFPLFERHEKYSDLSF